MVIAEADRSEKSAVRAAGLRHRRRRADSLNGLPYRVLGWAAAGLNRICGNRVGNAPGILTYHRIEAYHSGLPRPDHNVTPSQFESQLSGLLDRGYRFRRLSDLFESSGHKQPLAEKTVVLTFDDGFHSVYHNAWPILKRLRIPATVFLCTSYLDTPDPFYFDEWGIANKDRMSAEAYRALTTHECLEMADDGLVDFGAHTHTHRDFRGIPEEFQPDLQLSVDIVRDLFHQQETPFAFPFGSRYRGFVGDDLVAAAKATGVTCGLTTDPIVVDPQTDPFHWGRFNAFPFDTAATLAGKLNGWYSWAPKLRRAIVNSLQSQSRGNSGRKHTTASEMALTAVSERTG